MNDRGNCTGGGQNRNVFPLYIIILYTILLWPCAARAALPAPGSGSPVTASSGMVVSQHTLATRAALEVLKEGGNAVDAAVTLGFVEAVVLPSAGNLGGGGFMLLHRAETGETIAIDFREKAPASAHRDMFLDADGDPDPEQSQHSYRSSGVPGTVAGLALALRKYGSISLARALRPAIDLAENGFPVDEYLHSSLIDARVHLEKSPASMAIFFKPNSAPYEIGELLVQKDMAGSLRLIVRHGPKAFYTGEIAKKIAADMASHGGLITRGDLAAYRPVIRKPVHGVYRGYDIYSMPPPSSGGVHLIQMLNMLETFPAGLSGPNTPETINLLTECMKRAYADRSKYLGDPDFFRVPVEGITSKRYAVSLMRNIIPGHPTPSVEILPGAPAGYESPQTTHYSIMDRWGNAVAVTYTLNFSYGSGITAAGTGILLNNEMDDFSSKPDSPNGYGLLGSAANAIEPGKRMLSCMTPTLALKDGQVRLVTGSPGGSRIITTTLQIILNVLDHGMNVADATTAPRIHHQWLPDELLVERGMDEAVVLRLRNIGYTVKTVVNVGCTQTIAWDGGTFYGAADPRGSSSLAEGF